VTTDNAITLSETPCHFKTFQMEGQGRGRQGDKRAGRYDTMTSKCHRPTGADGPAGRQRTRRGVFLPFHSPRVSRSALQCSQCPLICPPYLLWRMWGVCALRSSRQRVWSFLAPSRLRGRALANLSGVHLCGSRRKTEKKRERGGKPQKGSGSGEGRQRQRSFSTSQ